MDRPEDCSTPRDRNPNPYTIISGDQGANNPIEDIERHIEQGNRLYEHLIVFLHYCDNQEAYSYGCAAIPRYPQRLDGEEMVANTVSGTSVSTNATQPPIPHSYLSPDVRQFPEFPRGRIG